MNRLLIIDDDSTFRDTLSAMLARCGFECDTAESGAAGLALARHRHPDLILCDLRMGDMDGLSVLARLRPDPLTARIPFILMTAHNLESTVRSPGPRPDDILIKPFHQADLTTAITSRLGLAHPLPRTPSIPPSPHRDQDAPRTLAELADGVVVLDTDHRILSANPAVQRLFALTRDPAGDFLPEILLPSQHPPFTRAIAGVAQGRTVRFEIRLPRQGCDSATLEVVASPRCDQGIHIGAVLAIRDVTASRTAEHRAAVAAHAARTLVDGLPFGVLQQDDFGFVTGANARAIDLLGLAGRNLHDLQEGDFLPSPHAARLETARQTTLRAGTPAVCEIHLVSPPRRLHFEVHRALSPAGDVHGTQALIRTLPVVPDSDL